MRDSGPAPGRAGAEETRAARWIAPGRAIVVARMADAAARFVLFLATARILAPQDFSRYALLTAALATCQWTLSLGGARAAMYFGARGERGPLFAWLFACAAGASLVLGAAAAFPAPREAVFPGIPAAWVLLGLSPLPFSLLGDSLAGTLLAAGRTRAYGATLALRDGGTAAVVLACLAAPAASRLVWILAGRLAVQAAVAALTAVLCRARPDWGGLPQFAPRALAYAGPTAVSDAAVAFHRRADVLLLSALGRAPEIGAYALAYAFAEAFWLVTDSLEAALFVDFARTGPDAARAAALRAARIYLVLGAAALAAGLAGGEAALLLGFRDRYPAAPLLFPWLLAAAIGWGISRPFFSYLSSQGKVGTLVACNLAGLAVNLVLNVLWIPAHGAAGAAAACVVSYAGEGVLWAVVFRRSGPRRAPA